MDKLWIEFDGESYELHGELGEFMGFLADSEDLKTILKTAWEYADANGVRDVVLKNFIDYGSALA